MAVSAVTSDHRPTLAATDQRQPGRRADRFLKLLVAQMQNQDPLNPMDNAQVTSQMAQINTVNGIEKLNTTVEGLSSQFMQMQALQGASLVGRDVIVPGSQLDIVDGVGQGGFELTVAGRRGEGRDPVAQPARWSTRCTSARRAAACTASTGPPAAPTNDSGLRFRVTATQRRHHAPPPPR